MYRSRVTFASTDAPAIAALRQSPSTTARCSKPNSGTLKPSTRQRQPSQATLISAARSAARFVTWRPRESMPRTQRVTIVDRAAAPRTNGYSSSRASTVHCLESLRRERARRSLSVSRSRSKSTAAATSGPAREPRPASSAPATKRRPSPRSKANSRLPVRWGLATGGDHRTVRGGRERGRRPLQSSDPARWPVGQERLADHPLLRDRPPFAAVRALAAVVSHHEEVALGDLDRSRQLADPAVATRADEGLLLLVTVEVDPAGPDRQAIAADGYDPLDEVRIRAL